MAESILAGNMSMDLTGADLAHVAEDVFARKLRNARDLCLVVLAWGGSWSIVLAGFYGAFGIF